MLQLRNFFQPKSTHLLVVLLLPFLLASNSIVEAKKARRGRDRHQGLEPDAVVSAILKNGDVSLKDCSLTEECDRTISLGVDIQVDSYSATADGLTKWKSLGLSSSNLHVNKIAVGFVAAFNEKLSPNSPADINAKLPRPMSIVGDYVEMEPWSSKMANLDWHLPTLQKLDGNPVWCIALMPTSGLETITWQVAHNIAKKMKHINEQGFTVWLRFGHEMNGDWYNWGMKPELFKQKWNLIAKEVKAVTDRTYMLWSPNALFGNSVDDIHGGYTQYWPGDDSVDIVGVSFYHWGRADKRINVIPTDDEVVGKIYQLNELYGSKGVGKPLVIAETAASYTYNRWSKKPVIGGSSEYEIKMRWLHLLLDRYIKRAVPNLRAMIWFEVIKDENATGNTPVRTEDFRLVLGNPNLSSAASAFLKNTQT